MLLAFKSRHHKKKGVRDESRTPLAHYFEGLTSLPFSLRPEEGLHHLGYSSGTEVCPRSGRNWHRKFMPISTLCSFGKPRQPTAARLIGTTSPASTLTVPQNFAHSFIMAARFANCVPR